MKKRSKRPVSALKRLRIAQDPPMSRRALSAASGVSLFTIRSHEQGIRSMKLETAKRYAKVLNISPLELME